MAHGNHDLATDLDCSPHCVQARAHQPVTIEGVEYLRHDRMQEVRIREDGVCYVEDTGYIVPPGVYLMGIEAIGGENA